LIMAIGDYIDRHNQNPTHSSGPPRRSISWRK
jgi:hypothetical protein